MLDSLGNTTAATGKGFAIGSAALTALALFAAYIQIVQTQITTQAETFVEKASFTAPADASQPYAVYEGYRKFAVVIPGHSHADGTQHEQQIDGAMFIPFGQSARALNGMEKGQVFAIHAAGEEHHDHDGAVEAGHLEDADRYTIHNADGDIVTLVSARRGSIQDVLAFYDVSLANPRLLGGVFIGVLLAFLFCALTMNAVGRAAYAMMAECRRQFGKMREAFRAQGMSEEDIADPMKWPKQVEHEGVSYPEYAKCVSISTAGAQKEMVIPAALAIIIPIAVGLVLSVPGVMGLLAGGLTSGFAVAVFMANAGGAWDNAKKLLESYGRISANDFVNNAETRNKVPEAVRESLLARAEEMVRTGHGEEYIYGKGSDDHKATVVGDTVGDPFKDTSGPSLNILIKLISIVSVVFAGLVVAYGPMIGAAIGLN